MPEWAQFVISGGAVIGFWAWARSQIVAMSARLLRMEAEVNIIKNRCANHREDFGKVFDKLSELSNGVARIEGKLE